MSTEAVIKVENVGKSFKVHHGPRSIKGAVVSLFNDNTADERIILNDISFEVNKGEFFGIVGRNGCGKSTLLKMLANIYTPDTGTISVTGSLSPFLEVGVGFNPELTAKENVYLNGALLGLTRKEINNKLDDIFDFAELQDFTDQKLKTFSSGMQVRLAFSVAMQAHAEILLVDEVLAVGDYNFQKKCFDVFWKLKKEGRTIVFVTHDMGNVEIFCDRAILIDNGSIAKIGNPKEVAKGYYEANK